MNARSSSSFAGALLLLAAALVATSQGLQVNTTLDSWAAVQFSSCDGANAASTPDVLAIYSNCQGALLHMQPSDLGEAGAVFVSSATLSLTLGDTSQLTAVQQLSVYYKLQTQQSPVWTSTSSFMDIYAAANLTDYTLLAVVNVSAGQQAILIPLQLAGSLLGFNSLDVLLTTPSSGQGQGQGQGQGGGSAINIVSDSTALPSARPHFNVLVASSCSMSSSGASTTCFVDPSGAQLSAVGGSCLSLADNSFCDCRSGIIGWNCAIQMNATYPSCADATNWATPTGLATDSAPVLASGNAFQNNRLELAIEAPLVHDRVSTVITLGDSTSSNYPGDAGCSYPGMYWTKEAITSGLSQPNATCAELYASSIPWSVALTCGFTNATEGSLLVYNGMITIQSTEYIPDGLRGAVSSRDLQWLVPISVSFPTSVLVTSTLNVFSSVDLQAILIQQLVVLPNPALPTGHPYGLVTLATSLQWPYRLSSTNVSFVMETGWNGRFLVSLNEVSTAAGYSEDCANASSADPSPFCTQLFQVQMTPYNSSVCSLDGGYQYDFDVICRGNQSACPLNTNLAAKLAQVDVQLASENFCSTVSLNVGVTGTLASFQDAGRSTSKSDFAFETPADRAYFQAQLASSQATITSSSIYSVQISPSSSNAQPIELYVDGIASSAFTQDGVNYLQFATTPGVDTANFDFLVSPQVFSEVGVDAQTAYTISAIVNVSFIPPGSKKRDVQQQQIAFSMHRRASASTTGSSDAVATTTIQLARAAAAPTPTPPPAATSTTTTTTTTIPVAAASPVSQGVIRPSSSQSLVQTAPVLAMAALNLAWALALAL